MRTKKEILEVFDNADNSRELDRLKLEVAIDQRNATKYLYDVLEAMEKTLSLMKLY